MKVYRGEVSWVPEALGGLTILLPTDQVGSETVAADGWFDFWIEPGDYVIVAYYYRVTEGFGPYASVQLKAGDIRLQDVPDSRLCIPTFD